MTALALAGGAGVAVKPGTPEFEATAVEIAKGFREATAAIVAACELIRREGDRLQTLFGVDSPYNRFCVEFRYDGRDHGYRYRDGDEADVFAPLVLAMKRNAWELLARRLGLRDLMSTTRRDQFDKQIREGEVPDITEDTITGVLLGLVGQANTFAAEAVREVFDFLRPSRTEYKTNNAFRVGRRVILTFMVTEGYGRPRGFRVSYSREKWLIALDNVMHALDGRGFVRAGRPPIIEAINATGPDGRAETEYFRARCFKNGNLHLEFKRLDLVKELNRVATGDAVLGADAAA